MAIWSDGWRNRDFNNQEISLECRNTHETESLSKQTNINTKLTHDYEGLKLNKYSASPSRKFKLKNLIDGKNSSQSKGRHSTDSSVI